MLFYRRVSDSEATKSMSIWTNYSRMEVTCLLRTAARLVAVLAEWLLLQIVQPVASTNGSGRTRVSAQAVRKCLQVSAYGEIATATTVDPCAVCLSEVRSEERVWELRNCRHVFHAACLDRWMDHDERVSCPLCRAPLMTQAQGIESAGPSQPSWAVERLLYLFADDLLLAR